MAVVQGVSRAARALRGGLLVLAGAACGASAAAEAGRAPLRGFIDFNGYYDTREFSVLTLNLLANLPARFQYFSLTN